MVITLLFTSLKLIDFFNKINYNILTNKKKGENMKNITYYYNEDKTAAAVLVSSGFGSGWSTWNDKELAYDSRVVTFWLAHKDRKEWMDQCVHANSAAWEEARNFFFSIGYELPYMGGFKNIRLEWVALGTPFIIHEDDGAESIRLCSDFDWQVFY